MTNFKETMISRCKAAGANTEELERLIEAETDTEVLQVLLDNHLWCSKNSIYTATELEALPVDTLKEADLATQAWLPLDFSGPVSLAGLLWEPFNVGADESNPYGELMNFKAANEGRRLPTRDEMVALDETDSKFGIYNGVFGRVFGGKLFLPAAGYRSNSSGTVSSQGSNGSYWSSSASSASYGYSLNFYSGYVGPSSNYDYSYGFAVRCVRPEFIAKN